MSNDHPELDHPGGTEPPETTAARQPTDETDAEGPIVPAYEGRPFDAGIKPRRPRTRRTRIADPTATGSVEWFQTEIRQAAKRLQLQTHRNVYHDARREGLLRGIEVGVILGLIAVGLGRAWQRRRWRRHA